MHLRAIGSFFREIQNPFAALKNYVMNITNINDLDAFQWNEVKNIEKFKFAVFLRLKIQSVETIFFAQKKISFVVQFFSIILLQNIIYQSFLVNFIKMHLNHLKTNFLKIVTNSSKKCNLER